MLILVKGAGDLATGTAVRLHRAGFSVVMTDIAQPTAVRRTVAFSQCIYDGHTTVEGITGRKAADRAQAEAILAAGEIPVLCDPEAAILGQLPFTVVVDAILAKKNLGTAITDAPIVLALGPGFTAGVDCHGSSRPSGATTWGGSFWRGRPSPTPACPATWGATPRSASSAPPPTAPLSRWPRSASRSAWEMWWPRSTAYQ